jgi:hypothetical protein
MRHPASGVTILAAALLALARPAAAQFPGITMPPSGGNQRAVVTQYIGPVSLTIDYHSPDVHGPSGEDRTGKIWGGLVPYGLTNLGFGTCGDGCPWRGGANENTVLAVSHDVEIDGKTLPAGSYGLHFIPGQDEWTVIFSKNSTSWGSFFYDPKEDALRVTARPAKSEYHEWLTYEFVDRQPDRATVALKWENLQLPWTMRVPDINGVYVQAMRRELRSSPGFSWQNLNAAAQFCLQRKINLEEALGWAREAANPATVGQENFTTLTTLSQLLEANGKASEASQVLTRALDHPSADPVSIHLYGRTLLAQKKASEAMKLFELNARRHPGVWPTEVGLMRGYAALGRTKEAIEHGRLAVKQAPDEANRKNIENMIKLLEQGKPID